MRPWMRHTLLTFGLLLLADLGLAQGGSFTAQIENFWRLVSNGGRGFTTLALGSGTATVISAGAPTISAGFGTVHSVGAGSNTASWQITITTSGAQTTGTLTLPSTANGWACWASDTSHPNDSMFQTATGPTSVSFLTTVAWTDGDVITGGCMGH